MTTYLYHKRHSITGLNYFGKTTTNPYTYNGSGKYWSSHLAKHGKNIETIQVWEFDDLQECSKFALDFSTKHNIVESTEWANLKLENGLDGGNNPYAHTKEAKQKRKATIAARIEPLPNNNTPERIAKAKITRAKTWDERKAQGLKWRGPDKNPRKTYTRHKPFVNRNTPESLAKAAETRARNKLNDL